MIKSFCKFILISMAIPLAVVAPVRAQGISDYIAGFPVMAGFAEQADSLVVFDKADGRILEGSLIGDASREAAAAFYRESLIQLGWQYDPEHQASGSMLFTHQGERLELAFAGTAPTLTIRVSLYPAVH